LNNGKNKFAVFCEKELELMLLAYKSCIYTNVALLLDFIGTLEYYNSRCPSWQSLCELVLIKTGTLVLKSEMQHQHHSS